MEILGVTSVASVGILYFYFLLCPTTLGMTFAFFTVFLIYKLRSEYLRLINVLNNLSLPSCCCYHVSLSDITRRRVIRVVDNVGPAVVSITSSRAPGGIGPPAGAGSGFFFTDDGYLITNDHVAAIAAIGGLKVVRNSKALLSMS